MTSTISNILTPINPQMIIIIVLQDNNTASNIAYAIPALFQDCIAPLNASTDSYAPLAYTHLDPNNPNTMLTINDAPGIKVKTDQ